MADNYETMNQESPNYGCFKEAVCIDASRVYDCLLYTSSAAACRWWTLTGSNR